MAKIVLELDYHIYKFPIPKLTSLKFEKIKIPYEWPNSPYI